MDENEGQNHVENDGQAECTPNECTASGCAPNECTVPGVQVAAHPLGPDRSEPSATISPDSTPDTTTDSTPDTSADTAATLPIVNHGGGSPGNANRLSHGRRSSPAVGLVRVELGSLPDSLQRVERQALAFRRLLEQAVIEVHGSVSLPQALAINTAARWERHGNLCLRWLREHEATLTATERLAYSKAIADASANRDKAVATLRLDRDAKENIFAMLYGERNGA